MSGAKERIIKYLDFKGIGKREFYRKIGVSNGFLDSGKEIGTDKVEIIMDNLPELNILWLLTGKGEMESTKKMSGNLSGNLSGNFENIHEIAGKMSGNLDSSENLGFDIDSKCKNCQILTKKYFEAVDLIKARDLSIERLIALNAHLQGEIEECKGIVPKTGTNN